MRQIDQSKKLAIIPRLKRKFHPGQYGEAGRRISAMWEVPEADSDLWYCGKNLSLPGPAMTRAEADRRADEWWHNVGWPEFEAKRRANAISEAVRALCG